MNREQALLLIEGAKSAESLLGKDPDTRFKVFAKLVHPDRATPANRERMERAFQKLNAFRLTLNGRATRNASTSTAVIGKWAVEQPMMRGDIADLYLVTKADTGAQEFVLKLSRDEADNDLLEQEYVVLRMLWDKDSFVHKYIPQMHERMLVEGRQANVMSFASGAKTRLTLEEIQQFYPGGLDFRHIVWMGNRALSLLGFAHRHGILHGAVVPEHLMFGPEDHGIQLVDWCYAVTAESAKHIPAMITERKDYYPPEVARKMSPTPGLDIYMLMYSLKRAAERIPKRFQVLFDRALVGQPKSRPDDAWDFQDKWMAAALDEYGPKKYIELKIPGAA